jgi:hypothetical protein
MVMSAMCAEMSGRERRNWLGDVDSNHDMQIPYSRHVPKDTATYSLPYTPGRVIFALPFLLICMS